MKSLWKNLAEFLVWISAMFLLGALVMFSIMKNRQPEVPVILLDRQAYQGMRHIQPYIQLCTQHNGVWTWHVQYNQKRIIGKCTHVDDVSTNKQASEET